MGTLQLEFLEKRLCECGFHVLLVERPYFHATVSKMNMHFTALNEHEPLRDCV